MYEPNEDQDPDEVKGRMTCMEPGCGATFVVRRSTDDMALAALLEMHSRIHRIEAKGSHGRLA
jgi:hypothetical protein